MTTERRLARIEAALTPRELVIRWLDEAHAHADLTAYLSAMLAQVVEEMPFDRLLRETRENTGTRDDRALRRAIGQTAFLYLLILRTAEITQTVLDKEVLVHAFLGVSLGTVTFGQLPEPPAGFPRKREQFIALRDLAVARADEVHALDIARARVEERYFGGRPVLFPGTRSRWDEQVHQTKKLAAQTIGLGERDGIPWDEPADLSALEARVDALVADHVEVAQAKALSEMGEGRRAASILRGWFAPNAG